MNSNDLYERLMGKYSGSGEGNTQGLAQSSSSGHEKIYQALMDKYSPKIDEGYISRFFKEADELKKRAAQDTSDKTIFNAADYFEERKKQADELKKRAAAISTHLGDNADFYTPEYYNALMETLSTFDTEVDDVLSMYQPSLDSREGMRAYEDELLAAMARNEQLRELERSADFAFEPGSFAANMAPMVRQMMFGEGDRGIKDNWSDEQRYRLGLMQKDDPTTARKYAEAVNAGKDPYLIASQEEQRKANLRAMDLNAEKREIDRLKDELDSHYQQNFDFTSSIARKAYDQKSRRLEQEISDREQQYNLAKREQEREQFRSAADQKDFASRSGYVSSGFQMPAYVEDADSDELVYEYINNPDIRSQVNQQTIELAQKGYDLLNEEEAGIYNYYYATEGPAKAQQYLDNIQDTLNQRIGERGAAAKQGDLWKQIMAGAISGYSNAVTSPQYFFDKDSEYINTSPFQYMSGAIREDLAETGKHPMFDTSLGQMAYDLVNTTANMGPSILLSGAAGAINPVLGKVVGAATMGSSAAGGSYQQALNAGYSKEQARAYAALSGASEIGLEYLLGGISKLGGEIPQSVIRDMVDGVDNAIAKAAITMGGSMAAEGFEEGLQEVITPWIENLTLYAGKNVNWNEVAYSTLLGALSGGVMEGPGVAVNTSRVSKIDKQLKDLGAKGNTLELAELIVKHRSGEQLSQEEYIKLVKSEPAMQILEGLRSAEPSEPAVANMTAEQVEEMKPTTTTDGNARLMSGNRSVDVQEFAEVKDGKAKVKLADGSTADYQDISFGTEKQGNQFFAVESLPVIDTAHANELLNTIRDADVGNDTAEVVAIRESYRLGYMGATTQELRGSDASILPTKVQDQIYNIGKQQRTANDAIRAQAKAVTAKPSGDYKKVIIEGKLSNLRGDAAKKRKAEIAYVDRIADTFAGTNVHVYESYKKNGKIYYKDNSGVERLAPNGKYVNDEIWVDLNSGDNGEGMMLNTFAHEMYHHIEKWNKPKARELAEFVVKELGLESVDKAVAAQIEKARAAGYGEEHFADMTPEQARNEVYMRAMSDFVADSLETVFTSGNPAEAIARLKTENRSLFDEIKAFVDQWVRKLKELYKGKTISEEGKLVSQLKNFEKIQQMFMEAMQGAGENYRAALEAVVEENAEPVDSDDIRTDGAYVTDGEGTMYSIRSMKEDIAEGKMFEDLKTYCGWTQKQVDTLRDQLTDLVAYMTPFRDILDLNETYGKKGRRFSPYKPNSDPLYKISMDFSTLCSKRLLTQYVIENLQIRENRPMSAEEQMAIRDMLNEYRKQEKGLQVACAMCYVEAARLKSPKQMQKWMSDPETYMRNYFADKDPDFAAYIKGKQEDFKESRGYARNTPKKDMSSKDVAALNKIRPRLRAEYKPSAGEQTIIEKAKSLPNSTYLTAANLANLSESDPTIYAAYTAFVRTATRSKSLETDEPYYYGDSRRDNGNDIVVTDSFIEEVNRENGMRFSSWSDWRIQHMLDYITAVIDNAVRGAAMHGYTKFPEEVRVLGKTGMMFNMSGVAGTQTGLNEDGSLSFSDTESINRDEAVQLREEFPETAGLQCIGVSDEHIVELLKSEIIDYVIPYHVSGLNKGLRSMANIQGWKDYTATQHAAIDKNAKLADAKDQEHWHEEPVFSEFFVGYSTGMTGIEAMRASADQYKKMCADRGLKPKFEQFSKEPNYWKLLIDRKMINQKTGNLIRQKPVTPTFDFDTIKAVVDRHVDNYDSNMESRALNHIVENWDSIPKRIRDLKKQGGKKTVKKSVNELSNQTLATQPTEIGQFSLRRDIVDVNGKEYDVVVELDKKVRKNVFESPKELLNYIKQNFIGLKIPVIDKDGNVELIEFAGEKEAVTKNGKRHPVLGELGYIKGDTRKSVVVNLVEVVEQSNYDPKFSSSDNEHGWMDENGWESRKTYVLTKDNVIYEAYLKIAKARDGRNILYGVNLNVKEGIAVDQGATTKRAAVIAAMPSGKTISQPDSTVNTEMNSLRNQQPTAREILTQVDITKRTKGEQWHLNQYRDRLQKLSEVEPQLADVQARIKELEADGKKHPELTELRSQERSLRNSVNNLKRDINKAERYDMFQKIVAQERRKIDKKQSKDLLKSYKQEQRDAIKEMQMDQRVLREQLTGKESDISIMEREFIRIAKKYEQLDSKTGKKSAKDAKTIADLRAALKEEAAAHKADSKTWEREFNRLLRDYETSGRQIERLEATIIRQRETAKQRVAGRRNTEMRHKIQKKVNDLNRLLLHGTKNRNVPEFLQDSVAAVLEAINMEVRDGDQRRKTFEATLARYDSQIAMTSDPDKVADLIRRRNEYEAKGDQFANRMDDLKKAYEKIRKENTGMELDEGIAGHLDSLFETVGNTPLGQMNAQQLDAVNDILNITMETVRNANKLLADARSAGVIEDSKTTMMEVRSVGGGAKARPEIIENIEKFGWGNLKPVQAFEVIGSAVLNRLFKNLRSGEDTLAKDLQEGKNFFRDKWKKYNGSDWDTDKKWKFTSTSGKAFELDLYQIMSLYALSKRDQARDHLRVGGFTFDSQYKVKNEVKVGPLKINAEVKITDASAYNLSDEILGEIIGKLTADQRAFVDSMQAYLSDNMAAKGNEVSLKKYGIRLFKDKNYFPLRVADQYMAKVREQQTGDRKLKNSGFTQEVVPHAKNPVVLSSFMEVWAEHVDEMSLYHSFVLPLDDLSRVLNYHDQYTEESAAGSVMESIRTAYGEAASEYIDNLIRDVNGGSRTDSMANTVNRMISKAKKAQTMASLSVAIQQPSSILRAMAMIDSKYFIGAKVTEKTQGRTWEEIKKHAPIAIIKEKGGFDTNVGKSTVDYLTDTSDYKGLENVTAFFKDEKYRDEVFGLLPAKMDELAWGVIWNAVKRETKDQHPNMDVNGNAFMKLVAERFTDVIVHTQVYDSVFSRSGMMRSKDTGAKMVTSFMAEPTTTANMLAMAIIQAKRGDISKRQVGRVVGSIAASIALNSFLVSFVYAMRDDDEEERFDEKWVRNFWDNVWEGINPLNYIPIARDAWSILQGFDIDRADMSLLDDLRNAFNGLNDEKLSPWDKTEAVLGAVGNIFGVPMKNLLRDGGALAKFITRIGKKSEAKTATGRYIARKGLYLSNGDEMILAIQRGDEDHIQRVFGRYKSQEEAERALQSAIGEKYREGELSAEEAQELLSDYFDRDDENEVYWLLDKWDYMSEYGTSDGYSKMGAIMDAIESGDDYVAEWQRYLEHGSDMSDIRSEISSEYKKRYLKADETGREEIRDKLMSVFRDTGLYESEIEAKFNDWDFESEYDMSYSAYKAAFRDGEVTEHELRGAMKFYGRKQYQIEEDIRSLKEDIAFRDKYGMTLSEMKDAYDNGDIGRNTLINALVYNGMTKTKAQEEVKKRDISNRLGIDYMELDDAYKAGDISRQTLYNSMIEAGSTKREADEAILGYDWLKKNYKKHPDLAIGDAKKFVIKIGDNDEDHTLADYGVTIDHYLQYAKLKPECKGVDADGDGKTDSGTLRDSIFRMIDSLPISDQEKDGLALISYGIKSIRKNAPWHKK